MVSDDNTKEDNISFVDCDLTEYPFSVRTRNIFHLQSIKKISDLVVYTETEMLRIPKFGVKSLREVCEFLEKRGLRLGMDSSNFHVDEQTDRKEKVVSFVDYGLAGYPFSARTSNIFHSQSIKKLSDLVVYTETELLRVPNCGARSLREVNSFLEQRGLKLGMRDSSFHAEKTDKVLAETLVPKFRQTNFIEFFKNGIAQLNEREREVIEKRSSLKGRVFTLAEIGNKFGVTRERIRQMEAKALRKLNKLLYFYQFEEFILEKVREMDFPLSVKYADEKIFELRGIASQVKLFKFISKNFFQQSVYITQVSDAFYITEFNQSELESYVGELKITASDYEGREYKSILSDLRPDSASPFYKMSDLILADLFSSSVFNESGGRNILVKFLKENSHTTMINSIILQSPHPLTNNEIDEKILKLYPQFAGRTQFLRTRLGKFEIGVYPLSFKTWGTIDHLNIDFGLLDSFFTSAQKFAERKESDNKQFHARELRQYLPIEYAETLTDWHISALLRDRGIGNFLSINTFGPDGQRRSSIRNDVISVLRKHGRPMKTKEVIAELQKFRTLPKTFQIHPVSPIKRVEKATWVLEEND